MCKDPVPKTKNMPEKLDNRHEIELAEGISIQLSPASLMPRLLARLIDFAIQMGAYWVLAIVLEVIGAVMGGEVASGLYMLIGFLVFWFYDPIFEVLGRAATPGKMLMKLRVVKLSGSPTDLSSSFLRALLWPFDLFPLGMAGITAVLATPNSQRLGDLAAGTLVVHVIDPHVDELPELAVRPIRPAVPLQREEQLAFIEFGRRHALLSAERQQEIVDSLEPHRGTAPSGMHYALGIAKWLSQNEG